MTYEPQIPLLYPIKPCLGRRKMSILAAHQNTIPSLFFKHVPCMKIGAVRYVEIARWIYSEVG